MCLTFEDLNLERFGQERCVALALSGGPDSMALAWLLSCWSAEVNGPEIHALTVDHGLRRESAEEAQQVKDRVKDWPKITPHILCWKGKKPENRIMEEARRARYRLMETYCWEKNISCLFYCASPRRSGGNFFNPAGSGQRAGRSFRDEGRAAL